VCDYFVLLNSLYLCTFQIFNFKVGNNYVGFLVFFVVGESPTSEFYVPTFRNTVPSSQLV
jgi:hypothetical protein